MILKLSRPSSRSTIDTYATSSLKVSLILSKLHLVAFRSCFTCDKKLLDKEGVTDSHDDLQDRLVEDNSGHIGGLHPAAHSRRGDRPHTDSQTLPSPRVQMV